jgi:CRP-like cAMP-binding protein
MADARTPRTGNAVLDRIPRGECDALLARARQVVLVQGEVLSAGNRRVRAVYFPTSGFAALLLPVPDHPSLAFGLVGREGMAGGLSARGERAGPIDIVVQADGTAWRVAADDFARALQRRPGLQREVRQSLQLAFGQLACTAACLQYQEIEARLAGWLLSASAYVPDGVLHFTHQQLADLLGVQRGAITLAAGALQRRQLIRYARGTITLVSRSGLEAAACRCRRTEPDRPRPANA